MLPHLDSTLPCSGDGSLTLGITTPAHSVPHNVLSPSGHIIHHAEGKEGQLADYNHTENTPCFKRTGPLTRQKRCPGSPKKPLERDQWMLQLFVFLSKQD